jgi:multidrug efflux system outer membrane protein
MSPRNKKITLTLALCLAALLQAGCSTGPLTPLEGPLQAPERFKGGDPNARQVQAKWWEAYNDATLNRLVETTLKDNPNLGVVHARLRAAREQVKVIESAARPQANAGASLGYSRTSPETPLGLALGNQSIKGSQYAVETNVAWEPDLWQRVANAVEKGQSQVELAKIDFDYYMLVLCAEVVQFYWQLRSAESELAVLTALEQSRAETVRLLQLRLKGELSGELELAKARAELANATAELQEAQRRHQLNEHSLATLTARPIAEFSVAPAPARTAAEGFLLAPPPALAPGLPAQILARRPDMAASTQAIRAAIADRNIAEAAFYPSISLVGNLGLASKDLDRLAKGRQFSIGPLAISLPVLDGGRNKANLAAADARYQEAVAAHKSKLLLALKEVDDALTDIATHEAAVAQRQQALDAAKRALAVAKVRQDKGLTTYLDVLDSERTLLGIERASVNDRAQALWASVQLVRALGGSWNAGDAVTPQQLYP